MYQSQNNTKAFCEFGYVFGCISNFFFTSFTCKLKQDSFEKLEFCPYIFDDLANA